MDLHNNRIGESIGADARTFEEVLVRVRQAIEAAIVQDGSGRDGTPVWLPRTSWGPTTDRQKPIAFTSQPAIQPTYAFAGHEHRFGGRLSARERQATLLEALARTPPENWTDSDVRAVIASQPYSSQGHPDRAAWHQRVRAYFEAKQARDEARGAEGGADADDTEDVEGSSGMAHVDAHVRQGAHGPIHVAAHSRRVPAR